MPSEIILDVGAEGGSLTVFGDKSEDGKWKFHLNRNELMLYDSDEDPGGRDAYYENSAYLPSLQEALKLLDKYPWFSLYPVEVHPEFFDTILSEVRQRGGEKEEFRWRETLKNRLPFSDRKEPIDSRIQPGAKGRMALTRQSSGMLGVYLTAAELTARGFIVSPTSRSARGADLLVTDQRCQKAWSVQVKTNAGAKNDWTLTQDAKDIRSDSHIYVFVNLKGKDLLDRLDFLVVPSREVAGKLERYVTKTDSHGGEGGKVWYYFVRNARPRTAQGWEVFGDPNPPESD
jgi:hypothetical protein